MFWAQLAKIVVHVIKKVEELGVEIVRLVSDNHKSNVAAMDILCGGQIDSSKAPS